MERKPSINSDTWFMLEGALLDWLGQDYSHDDTAFLVARLLTAMQRQSGHSLVAIHSFFHSAWSA